MVNHCIKDNCNSKLHTLRFLESTGIHKVCHPGKLLIKNAIISGPTKEIDVTCALKKYNKQYNCPLECFYVDTGKLNIYPGCDVEYGYRKVIHVKYMVEQRCDTKVCVEHVKMCCDDTPCSKSKCHDTPCSKPKCHDTPCCKPKCHDTPCCKPKKKCMCPISCKNSRVRLTNYLCSKQKQCTSG